MLGLTQEFARVPQTSFGFCTDASYELAGGGNVGDHIHPLSGPDHRPIEISVPDGSSEPWDFFIQGCAEVILPSLPAFHKAIAYSATGVRPRPSMLAYNVEDPRSLRIVTLGNQNALLGAFVTQCFGGRIEAGSYQRSLCAEHERRRQAATVGDAASGQDRRRGYRVDHRGYQR